MKTEEAEEMSNLLDVEMAVGKMTHKKRERYLKRNYES